LCAIAYGKQKKPFSALGTHRLVEFELAFVTDPDNHSALDRITVFRKSHFAGYAVEGLDLGQGIADTLAIFFDVSRQVTA
jgi:hypothetical protein